MFLLFGLIYLLLLCNSSTSSTTLTRKQHQPFFGGSVSTKRNTSALNTDVTRIGPTIQTCQLSSECKENNLRTVGCYGLSSNRSLVPCNESVSPCVCREISEHVELHCQDAGDCPFENLCVWSMERSNSSCIPCELFVSTPSLPPNCSEILIDVTLAPPDRSPTIMEACVETADCDLDFKCFALLQNNIQVLECRPEDTYSSCVCTPTHYLGCNMFKPCHSEETCVMEDILSNSPICIATEAVDKSNFAINRIFTLPHFVFTLLFVAEMCFICIKLALQGNTRKKLRLVAGGAFVLESLIGITSTVLQAAAIFLLVTWYSTDYPIMRNTIVYPSILYVISELVSVIAECRNIRKRVFLAEPKISKICQLHEQGHEEWPMGQVSNEVPKPQFSLSRRVIVKWICVVSCCANLAFGISAFVGNWSYVKGQLTNGHGSVITKAAAEQYKKRMVGILSTALVYLILHMFLCLRWRRKKILRIISALSFASLFGLVTFWAMVHESHFPH